jgi:ABC-type multidrug transport system fused ATPase/permease subunit
VRKIIKTTWQVLDAPERKRFTGLIMLDIMISIADILSLAILLWIVQFYIQEAPGRFTQLLPAWLGDKNSLSLIIVFVVFFGIKNLAAYFISVRFYSFIAGVAVRISEKNLATYQQSGFGEFTQVDSSVHIRKICYQPFEFCQHIISGIQQIITQVMLITLTIIAIVLFSPKLFLLLLIILLPPAVFVFYYLKKKLSGTKKNIQSSNEQSFQYALEALKGYVESNIYDRNGFFLDRFVRARKIFSRHLFHSISLQNVPGRLIEIFAVLGLFVLILIAKWWGNQTGSLWMTIGIFMAAAYKIIPGIVKILNIGGQMKAYEFALDSLQHDPACTNRIKPQAFTGISHIEMKNIDFEYEGRNILNHFSMTANSGDFIGIRGISGKGKTTIMNLLLGLLSPRKGEVLINNRVVEPGEMKAYWPQISYVRQQSFIIYDKLVQNITLEEKVQDTERLQAAIQYAGLDELIKVSPEGLDKLVTENGKNISGGQQQRIAIARALYRDSKLYLLDEPFNELDEASTNKILEHFKYLASMGRIIIMITHDQQSLSFCNKTISLHEA